jgi:hypothetical protein
MVFQQHEPRGMFAVNGFLEGIERVPDDPVSCRKPVDPRGHRAARIEAKRGDISGVLRWILLSRRFRKPPQSRHEPAHEPAKRSQTATIGRMLTAAPDRKPN